MKRNDGVSDELVRFKCHYSLLFGQIITDYLEISTGVEKSRPLVLQGD